MMISGLTGAAIPMIFYKLDIDPAIASGPLITTVNDLVAVFSYYGLAWGLILQLGIG
jgi:magnesium transporter